MARWLEKITGLIGRSPSRQALPDPGVTGVEHHVYLLDQYRDGRPAQEPVHVKELGEGRFRLLYSPGFVQGIAAGDEFRLINEDGAFEVLHRSGNLAIQVFHREPVDSILEETTRRVEELGGVLDGRIEMGMVFSIPIQAGFPAIEALFAELVTANPGLEWYFGNVYDPVDNVTPLLWWNEDF